MIPADWPHRDASRFVVCKPHLWHVQEMGTGPLLLLIHGAGGSTHSWRQLMPLLAQHFRVVAMDLPGQGYSRSGARSRLGLDGMSTDLLHLCAHEGWQPDAIIGHSAGAAIALRLTELLPHKPRAVIGINAALSNFDGVAGWLFPLLARALTLAPFVPQIFARISGTPAKVNSLLAYTGSPLDTEGKALYQRLVSNPGHVDATLAMMSQWKLDGLLARLPAMTIPLLLIAADQDGAVPCATSRNWAARMPNAEYVEIPGHGHLVHEEVPKAVAGLILSFLARHPA
ncbi:alpha/beta fold hydrolase BchO [Rhodobacter ferrooxidans]|uniref:Magnesium chelatase accessory protein n=1 Tax=Rhodobacter ferrooxidans TaxID=371731 RepID=C8RYP0_9RHOB|nr:alpha/beta fold hydrolase BchO [Rhodobacter sp. SW2]EEW26228.1 magnesium chelatase accessory protein [Rhodobacter sp. SW2]